MKKMYRYPKTGRTRYRVTVADDGAIKVKHNDSLDQYSMAIHGVPINEHEYLRVRNGQLVPVANVDLLHTHETLYHIPTRKMFGKQGTQLVMPAITVTAKSLFKSEKQWRMVKYFEKQHRLSRDRSIKLTKAIIGHLHPSGVGFQTFVLLRELTPLKRAYSASHVLGVWLGPLLSLVGAFLGLHTALTSQADKIELMAFC
ncbi:MAG: hypothetical protein ACI814_004125 [Mariniblastus sp.]|jgi:hypothetical protein